MSLQIDESDAQSRWTTAQLTVTLRFVRTTRAPEEAPRSTEPHLSPDAAREFVVSAELAKPPLQIDVANAAGLRFDTTKAQAAVVGSDIISFVKGVSSEERSDIANASLLAQLAANKKIPQTETLDDVDAWYDAYFDVLSNIGFVVQDRHFVTYTEGSPDFETHEAIFNVARVLLAESPEALSLVKMSLDVLRETSANSPANVLFNRASKSVSTPRFQITVVDHDEDTRLRVSLMAFRLQARSTHVLFFKSNSHQVRLQHFSSRLAIDAEVLAGVREPIARKLALYMEHYIRQLPDL